MQREHNDAGLEMAVNRPYIERGDEERGGRVPGISAQKMLRGS